MITRAVSVANTIVMRGPKPAVTCAVLHRWRYVRSMNEGPNYYSVCKVCGQRRVEYSKHGGYQPINWGWLNESR